MTDNEEKARERKSVTKETKIIDKQKREGT